MEESIKKEKDLKRCSIIRCTKEVKTGGLCGMHYTRMQRGKDLYVPPAERKVTYKFDFSKADCLHFGCSRKRAVRHYCQEHYIELFKVRFIKRSLMDGEEASKAMRG